MIMKKYVVYFWMLTILLLPMKTKAANITETSISGPKEVTVGQEFSLRFQISTDCSQMGDNPVIVAAEGELKIDSDVLIISKAHTDYNNLTTNVVLDDNQYTFVSQSNETQDETNMACDNFYVDVTFLIKNTDATSTTIQLGEVSVDVLDLNDSNGEPKKLTFTAHSSHTIKIQQDSTAKNSSTNKATNSSTQVSKSSNTYLKSLSVAEYDINFDKDIQEYKIEVDENINQLQVKAELEDTKATYQIIGADNLKEHDYQVTIVVTSELGTTKTYYILAKLKQHEKSSSVTNNMGENDSVNDSKEDDTNSTKIVKYIMIGVASLIGIIIMVLVFYKIRDHKINKMLDDL